MRIEKRIHCGTIVAVRDEGGARITETVYEPGEHLTWHAHSDGHVSILAEGSYLEKADGQAFLRLPGDRVAYPEFWPHENWFGALPSRCINVEGEFPISRQIPEKVAIAKRLIETRRTNSLRPLAKVVGLHPIYLARAFRNALGISVGQAVQKARLLRASTMILRGDESLGFIALEAGYYDQSQLTNEMRRIAGFTPNQLRRLADR